MIEIGNIERRFLQIVGVGQNDENGRLFDMQNGNMTLQDTSTRYEEWSDSKENKTTYKYKSSGCRMEFIQASEFAIGAYQIEELHKMQIFRVIRDNVSYALEHDLNNGMWAIYIGEIKSEDTDYRSGTLGISTQLIKDYSKRYSKISIETIISIESGNPARITAENNAIRVWGSGVRYKKGKNYLDLSYTPMNYESTLAENIDAFSEYDKSNRVKDFLPLLCNEIIEDIYTRALATEYREEVLNELYQKRDEFRAYFASKNGYLNKYEESFLNSMGIEIDEFDYNLGCNVLFDTDTAETLRCFGMRNIRSGHMTNRIDTYALNGTIVDIAREIPDSDTYSYYHKIKQNSEVIVVRNDMEFLLQYSRENGNPSITLHIGKPNRSYYADHDDLSYYSSYYSTPYVKMSLSSNNRIFVSISGAKEFNAASFSFSSKKIYINGKKIPFTIENFQNCLADKLQDIATPKIRDEFIYQLPLLSEVIPMTLITDSVEEYSTCGCNHEVSECRDCIEVKKRATKLKELKSLLEEFNAHMILQAENRKSGAIQKTFDEV